MTILQTNGDFMMAELTDEQKLAVRTAIGFRPPSFAEPETGTKYYIISERELLQVLDDLEYDSVRRGMAAAGKRAWAAMYEGEENWK
jgi:glutamine phosphoribosylpyrophosphate amidotransferase